MKNNINPQDLDVDVDGDLSILIGRMFYSMELSKNNDQGYVITLTDYHAKEYNLDFRSWGDYPIKLKVWEEEEEEDPYPYFKPCPDKRPGCMVAHGSMSKQEYEDYLKNNPEYEDYVKNKEE